MKFLYFILTAIFITVPSVWGYTNLTPEQVHNRLVQADTLLLLDVREVSEYQNGHIAEPTGQLPITPVNMPYNSGVLSSEYSRLPQDIDIIVYCWSGGRSSSASTFLESKGYTRIFNMQGGFSSWTFASRKGGYGDHSGQWIHKTDTQPTIITCTLGIDTSKISFPPTAVPEADDSMYVELHLDSSNVNNPPLIPSSELKGLYRITVLNRFGLSQFGADSLVLSDTVNIVLFPEYISDKNTLTFTSQDMSVYVPGEGWRTVDHEFQDYSFQKEEEILRKWYNVSVFLTTSIASDYHIRSEEIHIFPNPFNSAIQINTPDNALINIYDSRGRLIERIKNQKWTPKSTLCSGIYFITIKYSNEVITRKVTYLK